MHIPDHMILNQLRESPSVPIEDFAINDSKNVEVDSTKAKAMSPWWSTCKGEQGKDFLRVIIIWSTIKNWCVNCA